MGKSIVGDPVSWPGLVYSPINAAGLIFALGAVSAAIGLIFEEFSGDGRTAICRRKTDAGWERLTVAVAARSSEYIESDTEIDLLICWIDDSAEAKPPRLVLSDMNLSHEAGRHVSQPQPRGLESILPEGAANDLLERGRSRESYEDTIRKLDEQIKKLQNE